jgi:hypothetical protein
LGWIFYFLLIPLISLHSTTMASRDQSSSELERKLSESLAEIERLGRKLKIEDALEMVRAKAMAMRSSGELAETSSEVFHQIKMLNIKALRTGVGIFDDENEAMELWLTTVSESSEVIRILDYVNLHIHPVFENIIPARKEGKPYSLTMLAGNDVKAYYKTMSTYVSLPQQQKHNAQEFFYSFFFSAGAINVISIQALSKEECDILVRFAHAFGMIYTRFQDLQTAEAQAHEARIEASLERVRTVAMSMIKSDHLLDVCESVYKELQLLGYTGDELRNVQIVINNDDKGMYFGYQFSDQLGGEIAEVAYDLHPVIRHLNDKLKQSKDAFADIKISGPAFQDWKGFVNSFPQKYDEKLNAATELHYYFYSVGIGALGISCFQSLPDDKLEILQRLRNVFGLAYQRYSDISLAEAQTREARIEASLERVRSKTIAMHNSQDVGNTVAAMFDELVKLAVEMNRCGILIFSETSKTEVWTARSANTGTERLIVGHLDMNAHPMLQGVRKSWAAKDSSFIYELKGDDIRNYYEAINNTAEYPAQFDLTALPSREYHADFFFPEGAIFAFNSTPISEEAALIFKRFAGVFGQTYRRFLDLQKAEANALDAVRRASLDRVRAETASMRTMADLERITPLIWSELTTLGVPFIRCGVFIMDEEAEQIQTFLSTPDGKAIAAFNTPYSSPTGLTDAIPFWRKKEIYKTHWDEAAFARQATALVDQGAISSPEKYLTENRPTSLHLHFLPFLQGMLYVGNMSPLGDEQLQLVQSLADAFSTAYARYEDFNKLESAKAQIENTLVDLKQAQQQLVQSEKMASLGELTAGIAHEIQNPLNFVNNFSEVSVELIEEMMAEVTKGNNEEMKSIARDLVQNLQKINHHGKRADGIVKGMLQHSRTSSGQKEATDINELW